VSASGRTLPKATCCRNPRPVGAELTAGPPEGSARRQDESANPAHHAASSIETVAVGSARAASGSTRLVGEVAASRPVPPWRVRLRSFAASTAAASSARQAAVHLFDQVLDSDMPPKLAAIGVMVLVDAKMRAEPIEHLNDLGCLPFGKQVDL
jgi:hypothetical protein